MKPGIRKALRLAGRRWPLVVGALVLLAVILGAFRTGSLVELGALHIALLSALAAALGALGWRHLRHDARERQYLSRSPDLPPATQEPGGAKDPNEGEEGRRLWEEAQLGALLVVAGYALIQPVGGLESPLYPLIYLLVAFLAAFLPRVVAGALTLLAIAIDVAVFAAAGALASHSSTLVVHVVFLAVFALLSRFVFASQVASGRAAARLAEQEQSRERASDARLFRLTTGMDQKEHDEEKWAEAALVEVGLAVENALEVAEVALATNSVAVFLLHRDESQIRLHGARAHGEQLRLDAFDSREGLLGAALRRRMPMRLCGDLRGITWYGRSPSIGSVLFVPLIDRRGAQDPNAFDNGRLLGIVIADRIEAREFSDDDERILVATSREILRAIETERVMGYVNKARDEKELFFTAVEKLNQVSKKDEVIETTVSLVQEMPRVGLDFVALTTTSADPETGERVHRVERFSTPEIQEAREARKREAGAARARAHELPTEDASGENGGSSGEGVEGEKVGEAKEDLGPYQALEGLEFADNQLHVSTAVRRAITLPIRDPRIHDQVFPFDSSFAIRGMHAMKIIPLMIGETDKSPEVLGTLVCGSRRRNFLDPGLTRLLEILGMQAAQSLKRAALFEETKRMATTDGLTSLLNHRTFQDRFDEELNRSRRFGGKLSLILVDIDHFKSVNDAYGHATGDEVLRGIAKVIAGEARNTDVVARYGGEEFALLLPGTDAGGAKTIAERIRLAAAAKAFDSTLGPLRCTLSLGIATFDPLQPSSKQSIFDAADQCLYFCKRMGRDRSATVEEMSLESRKKAAGEPEG